MSDASLVPINRLQMHWREVSSAIDASRDHLVSDPIAMRDLELRTKAYSVDKPADSTIGHARGWQLQVCARIQPFTVKTGDFLPFGKYRLNALELCIAESGVDFGKPIIVAEFDVIKPIAGTIASLVAQCPRGACNFRTCVTTAPPSPVVICLLG